MMRLHGYWRSGAAWRVRIALALKSLDVEQVTHDLRLGEQRDTEYAALNGQQLVPALEADGRVLTQSLAILEWLEESHPAPPLLPTAPSERALVRAMAMIVCCDIHPLGNLRVLTTLREDFAAGEDAVKQWVAQWIDEGLSALEAMVADHGGLFAFGDTPTMADCCLVPQVYTARRFDVPLTSYPLIVGIVDYCGTLDVFARAHPSAQPDSH